MITWSEDDARKAQSEFQVECNEAREDAERGRYAVPKAWEMFHMLDAASREIERLRSLAFDPSLTDVRPGEPGTYWFRGLEWDRACVVHVSETMMRLRVRLPDGSVSFLSRCRGTFSMRIPQPGKEKHDAD